MKPFWFLVGIATYQSKCQIVAYLARSSPGDSTNDVMRAPPNIFIAIKKHMQKPVPLDVLLQLGTKLRRLGVNECDRMMSCHGI